MLLSLSRPFLKGLLNVRIGIFLMSAERRTTVIKAPEDECSILQTEYLVRMLNEEMWRREQERQEEWENIVYDILKDETVTLSFFEETY